MFCLDSLCRCCLKCLCSLSSGLTLSCPRKLPAPICTPRGWTVGLKYAYVRLLFIQRICALGSYESQESWFCGISDYLGGIGNPVLLEHLSRMSCVSPWQMFLLLLMLSVCGREVSFSSCTWIRLLRLFALSWSHFISVHKQQGILLQDVFVIATETRLGQSRQVRLENLVKVFLGTRCFPMRRHFAFQLLAALSALPGHLIQMFQLKNILCHSFSEEVLNEVGGWSWQLL